ncbi:hypothetical protein IT411_03200, partial [Candidatus Peregrinibacteria bacterium]|nr:hypothetical protein [Candidatus Peregrinibacteria bacterium]
MNLPTKLLAGVLVTASLGASIVGAQSTSTTNNVDKAGTPKMFHLKFDPAKHAEELKLIEAGDYTAWAALQK